MLFWGLMCFIVDVSISAMITCLLDLSQLLAKRDQPSTKLAESLGKEDQGALPLTVVNTRDLHSRGQQHQEGCPDKLFTNLIAEEPSSDPLALPKATRNEDELNQHAGKTMPRFLRAAIEGTNQAYREVERPTADLIMPKLDAYHIGQTFQMFMLATVLEGQLIDINPYGQPGVEAYKKFMKENLENGRGERPFQLPNSNGDGPNSLDESGGPTGLAE